MDEGSKEFLSPENPVARRLEALVARMEKRGEVWTKHIGRSATRTGVKHEAKHGGKGGEGRRDGRVGLA